MALGRDRWGTDNHHAAGSAVIAYLNRVTRPLISQYVLERLPSGIKKGTIVNHLRPCPDDAATRSTYHIVHGPCARNRYKNC